MDSWERFDEIFLPDKKYFHRSLNMEDITDVDYRHSKKVSKEFGVNNPGNITILGINKIDVSYCLLPNISAKMAFGK